MLRSTLPVPMPCTAAVTAEAGIILAAGSRFRNQVELPGIHPIGNWHEDRGWPATLDPEADAG